MEDEDKLKKIDIIETYNDDIGDENVYSEIGRERLLDDGELSVAEDAFMQGYEKAYD